MRALSALCANLMLVATPALAEPPAAPAGPLAVPAAPAPPEPAPLSRDFQASMADSQLQTYRYNQLAEQALALRKLCETGFGPADLCARTAQAAGPGAGERAAEELPAVAEIDGARGTLSAVLVMADGRRLAVRPGSVLPGGLTVVAITGDEVRAATPAGRAERLPFADRERRR